MYLCRTFVDLFVDLGMVNTKQDMCSTFVDLFMVNTKQNMCRTFVDLLWLIQNKTCVVCRRMVNTKQVCAVRL